MHPALQIIGEYMDEVQLNTEIQITYTGIYTMKARLYMDPKATEEAIQEAYAEIQLDGPIEYKQVFDSPEQLLPHIKELLMERGQAEIIETYLTGAATLTLNRWDGAFWETMQPNIHQALLFMRAYVGV